MSKVLIVEDDLTNRLVFTRILTKVGDFEVHCTDDVDDVLTHAQSGQIDLILMDVGLPNSRYQGQPIDGLKITQILKADPDTSGLPIVLVTAFTMPGDKDKFLKSSGADGYIPKPVIDHRAFVEQVNTFLLRAENREAS